MSNDEIARYLNSLEREDCYRVDATLKESPHELTQRVFFVGANGAEQGPFVRKFIRRESGIGSVYERIYAAQQTGRQFKHIPALYECYRNDDLLVVVMEFVIGETLQDLVYRRDPSERLAAEVFPILCDAVTELHESFDPPIIHRDLKPSNVMLTGDGLAIIDFGIAREFKEGADADTTRFGTRAFAPPEQFGFGQTTVRSDVYALGMMLYFCLTEEIPTAQLRDAKFEVVNVPPRLRPVLARATELDPEERYASTAELKTAFLDAMAQGEREVSTSGGVVRRVAESRTPAIRFGAISIGAACVVAALVAAFVLWPTGATGTAESQGETREVEASIQAAGSQAADSQVAGSQVSNSQENASEATGNEIAEREASTSMQTGAPQRDGFDPDTNLQATIAGVTFQIPGYFGASTNESGGRVFYYAESGSSLSMVMASEDVLTPGEDADAIDIVGAKDSYLVGLVQSNEELFAKATSSVDCQLAGFPARIVTFEGTAQGLSITTKIVYFIDAENDSDGAVVGTLAFGQSANAQFDYSGDFAKTIASATPAS